jgi:hypothetical protein
MKEFLPSKLTAMDGGRANLIAGIHDGADQHERTAELVAATAERCPSGAPPLALHPALGITAHTTMLPRRTRALRVLTPCRTALPQRAASSL